MPSRAYAADTTAAVYHSSYPLPVPSTPTTHICATCNRDAGIPLTRSKGLAVAPAARYSCKLLSNAVTEMSSGCAMLCGPPAFPPSWARYSVARSRTSSSLSSSARWSNVMTRGRRESTCSSTATHISTEAPSTWHHRCWQAATHACR
jgi:hypothetical protein